MAEFSNAARKIIPQLPSGGGSALLTIAGLTGVGYGLYNSAVTGAFLLRLLCAQI